MSNAARTAAGILVILTAAFWAFSISALGEDKYPACKAVSEMADYGSGLSISESTKALIESYREDWKIVCGSKGGRKPSLADILVKAKQIEADFKKVFDSFDESILNEPAFDPRRAVAINDLVSNKFTQFVPAFKGAYGEHEMFSPSIDAFRKNASRGTSEDRTFLESQIPLEGDFPPYITKTWDYGGCDQYGEYDWTGALKRIDRVKKQVKSAAYLNETSKFEDGLVRELTTNYDICTCKAKEAVLKDLLDVQKYVKKEPGYSTYVPKVQQTIDSIQSGKINVKSEMEKHCSGG
jgi:hypothetical protein